MADTVMDWDLKSYFPEFKGNEMNEFKTDLEKKISITYTMVLNLKENSGDINLWEELLTEIEDLSKKYSHIRSYVGCLASADANNQDYLKEEADLSLLGAEFQKIEVVVLSTLENMSPEMVNKIIALESMEGASYYISRLYEESKKRMTNEKEILATELGVDGLSSWGRLYNTVSGKLTFEMKYPDGTTKETPMSQRRSLLENPDREIRKEAFYGGNRAWEQIEDVAAASLNAISGTRLTLNKHREIDHFLDVALFQSAVSRETLDALFEAIYDQIEIPKNILRYKAKLIGAEKISWYDLGAPLDIENREVIDWEKAKSMVYESFESSYPRLGKFVKGVYEENWIDWSPRPGKRPGGFCTGSLLTNESRIFMTYNNSLGDVLTLAHEAGHAFHSYIMRDIRPYGHSYPMTLAETASTFGEMILAQGILNNEVISDDEKALILDTEINHGAIYLMDIPVRYEFEKALYEERQAGVLSPDRLKELMVETQEKVFGDTLDEKDPYFWASKLHFYITGVTFYNFPYTFGYLLSRFIFGKFLQEGSDFLEKYEYFLKLSGSFDCEEVVSKSLGVDITSKDFWAGAIGTLEEPLGKLKELQIK
jgi:oligoendopeptidase F